MTKNVRSQQPSFVRNFQERALNILAVCLAVLPIIFVGMWVYGLVQDVAHRDTRKVSTLSFIEKSSTPQLFFEPLVSVTFDDGWTSAYVNGMPLLSKYHIRTTQFLLPGEFDDPNYVSIDQAHSMKKAGHEIGSHTVDHKNLTTLDETDLSNELTVSKSMLQKENLVPQYVDFASPNSAVNDQVIQSVKKSYASHRNTLADIGNGMTAADVNLGPVLPRYSIIGFSVRNNTTAEQIKQALDYTKNNNGWLVLVYHQIDDSNELFSVNKQTFESQLKIVTQSKLKIVTIGDVMATNPRQQ